MSQKEGRKETKMGTKMGTNPAGQRGAHFGLAEATQTESERAAWAGFWSQASWKLSLVFARLNPATGCSFQAPFNRLSNPNRPRAKHTFAPSLSVSLSCRPPNHFAPGCWQTSSVPPAALLSLLLLLFSCCTLSLQHTLTATCNPIYHLWPFSKFPTPNTKIHLAPK